MNIFVLNVAVVFLMLTVDICHSQTTPTSANFTCGDLPKVQVPNNEVFIANSPFRINYELTQMFDCRTKVFTKPARGITTYNGTLLAVKESNVISIDYSFGSDGKTINATMCNTGAKSVWYLYDYEFNDDGGFFCLYTCNGAELAEFTCDSNNNGTSPKIMKAVNAARQVPNGNGIRNAWENCPGRHGCQVF